MLSWIQTYWPLTITPIGGFVITIIGVIVGFRKDNSHPRLALLTAIAGIIVLIGGISSGFHQKEYQDTNTKYQKEMKLKQAEIKTQQDKIIVLQDSIMKAQQNTMNLQSELITQTKQNADLQKKSSKRLLDYTTGGVNDFYLNPRFERPGNDHINLTLEHLTHLSKGKYPHYNVRVIISDLTKRSKIKQDPSKFVFDNIYETISQSIIFDREIGTIPPGMCFKGIMRFQFPNDINELKLIAHITSRNGDVAEPIYFKKVNNEWKVSYRVVRNDPFGPKQKDLHKEIDPDVPLTEKDAMGF